MEKLKRYILYAGCILRYFFALFVGLFARFTPAYKGLWLIAERGTDARDNGFHLFRYINQEHPEISCAYVIDRNSPDYPRVSSLGRIIQRGSFSHYLAFACAKAKIGTHIMGYAPNIYLFTRLDEHKLVPGKKIFLQHGIILNDIPALYYPRVRLNLFVCSAKFEYEDIAGRYHYPKGVVQLLGLCRYDQLLKEHTEKRQILVMPTWRAYLKDCHDEKAFRQSEYFRAFDALLHHPRLYSLLEQHGYELVFYLHQEMQRFTSLFTSGHPRVKIADLAHNDVQQLLMESKLLITDFSSVFFDFSYMEKPLAFFQFDEEAFFSTQYRPGYFRYREDGFGPVCSSADKVLDFIQDRLEDGMQVPASYRERIENFFTIRNTDNCARTVAAIRACL